MRVALSIDGLTPYLMHNVQLADPLNPIARQIKMISGKRKKTDDELKVIAHLEFIGGLYHDEKLGPYVKGLSVEKSLVEGARISRLGKQVERALFISDGELPMIYSGPREPEALWEDESFRDMQMVRVGTSRVPRYRPIFRDWSLEGVEAELDTSILNLDQFRAICDDAGAMVGLGDYRPRYGRYKVTVTAL
jgi:hypothetical protein